MSEYSDICCSFGSDSIDYDISLEPYQQSSGMSVVEREGQWFRSDVDWVVFGSYPLELYLSAPYFLLDVVDDLYEVLASSVGVDGGADVDSRLRVSVDDCRLHLCVGELLQESTVPDDVNHGDVDTSNLWICRRDGYILTLGRLADDGAAVGTEEDGVAEHPVVGISKLVGAVRECEHLYYLVETSEAKRSSGSVFEEL